MLTLRSAILGSVLVLFTAVGAMAQAPIGVSVGADDTNAVEITNQLRAKIGGTAGYVAYDSSTITRHMTVGVEVSLRVYCLVARMQKGAATGYVCKSEVEYLPPPMKPLHTHLAEASSLAVCDMSGKACAEGLFEAFVNGTQPEILAAVKSGFERSIDQYIQSRRPNK